ncbi:hypothetical protein [Hanstruepera ponticola]|uniref:hypothetical protein n=1 Tax=Hanstruepera ponticola TaxID=2042995 RepID=UPI000CF03239|nr:hypothetical protein [Hanstruepera ponticola]
MNTIERILEKIQNAKALDFGNIFNDSIELFKKTWMQGFLLQLFSMIIMLPLILIIYVPLIGVMIAQAESGDINPDAYDAVFAGFSVLFIILIIVGALVLSTVTIALQAGFFRIMKRLDHDEEVLTSDFFHFIKGKYLGKLFVLMLASVVISSIATLLCFLPLIYVMVPMSFFTMFFAFNPELSVSDIIKGSFALGNKKWLLVFGLLIVSSLLAQIIGMILCGIGVLFTAAFVYHPTYLVYKNVVGFNSDSPINHIVE